MNGWRGERAGPGCRARQTGEGDGIFLGLSDRARAERFTWHSGHGDQGRVRVELRPDGPGRKPGRIACEQLQRAPLAARLITIGAPLILVRDSKDHGHGHVHRFTPASWRAFVAVVHDRESGLDESGRQS